MSRKKDFEPIAGSSRDGQSAPYCMFAPAGVPCRRGPLDLAIETASSHMARLDTGRQNNSALGVLALAA
jgi:hypothetical protein